MTDLRPDIAMPFSMFGLPAIVTLPGEEPVETTAIWLSSLAVQTAGVLVSTNSPQKALALPRADVPAVPRGTVIDAAELEGGPVLSWIVEAILAEEVDEVRVLVIPEA